MMSSQQTTPIQVANTKRAYRGLSDYAQAHGAPATAYEAAGWREERKDGRPAISFPTTNGKRWRFLDDEKPPYKSEYDYKSCWYYLLESIQLAQKTGQPLVIGNGESSSIVAQYYGVAATAITGGEKSSISKWLLDELRLHLPDDLLIIVAFDCDETGTKAGIGTTRQLQAAGIDAIAVNLGLSDGGDLGDFCSIHQGRAVEMLASLEPIAIPQITLKPNRRRTDMLRYKASGDYEEAIRRIREDEIPHRLGVQDTRTNSAGFTIKRVANPFVPHEHDDKSPACRYSFDSGVFYDPKGGHTYKLKELCRLLNIEWPKRQRKSRKQHQEANIQVKQQHISQWAEPIDLPALEADIVVNQRYVSDVGASIEQQLLDYRNILIKSPIDTGKTSLVEKLIKQAESGKHGARVLIITHREQLAVNIAERFYHLDFVLYNNFIGTGVHWQAADRVVCSLDSLHKLSGYRFDIVVIDEIDQFIPQLWSDTMTKGENTRAATTLFELVAAADHFIGLDAHLTTKTRQVTEALRGKDTITLRNDYIRDWGPLTLCRKAEVGIERGLEVAQVATKPVVFLAYLGRSKVLYELCLAQGFKPEEIMLINGDTSQRKAQREFRRNIDENLPRVKILIVTPTFDTGIDIQCAVAGVYALFDKQPLTPTKMLQMLGRCRNAGERCAWVQYADYQNVDTNPNVLYARPQIRAHETSDLADFDSYDIHAVNSSQKRIQKLYARWTADENQQRQMLFSTFVAYAKAEGYTLKYDNRQDSAVKNQYKAAKEAVAQRRKELSCQVEAVSPNDHRELKKQGQTTDETDAGLLRWQIENETGISLTPDLYDLFYKPAQRRRLRRYIDLHDDIENLKAIDRHEAQQGTLLIKRGHLTAMRQLVASAITTVFGQDGLDSNCELTQDEIEARLVDYLAEYGQAVLHHIDRRSDLSKDTLSIFRRVLAKVGIKLAYRQVMEDGKRFYLYFIDSQHLALWRNLARIGLAYRHLKAQIEGDPRHYLKRGIELSLIRDLSNPLALPIVGVGESNDYERWKEQIEAIPI